ncbi:hypothetical protein NCC49_003793 [Naganishia albida]|nr:hypothetical protein NCC49_003793 [Naganishia albida]
MTPTSPRPVMNTSQGYFDITPRPYDSEGAARESEMSRKEKAKRRYSQDIFQHTMDMWQTMSTGLRSQRSGSISSTMSNGSHGPLTSAGSNGIQGLVEEKASVKV